MSNGGCDGRKKEKKSEARGGGSMHDLFPFFPHSFQHAGREFGPGLASALFMSAQHILRLNICWFVKSTNTRSCPSPWHISSADRKHCRTFNWWEPRLVTRTTAVNPSPAQTEAKRRRGWGVGGWCIWEGTALGEGRTQGRSFPLREDSFQEGPPTLICAHLSLCSLSP